MATPTATLVVALTVALKVTLTQTRTLIVATRRHLILFKSPPQILNSQLLPVCLNPGPASRAKCSADRNPSRSSLTGFYKFSKVLMALYGPVSIGEIYSQACPVVKLAKRPGEPNCLLNQDAVLQSW